jgi:acetyl-CoA acyltransferase
MGDVFVAGAATTRFGRSRATLADLTHEAVTVALADCGLAPADVAAVFVGCGGTGSVPGADALTVRLGLRRVGLARGPDARLEHVSAAGARALHLAWRAVESEMCDVAVCVGAERLPAGGSPTPDAAVQRRRSDAARTYMAASGATVEHLALTAAKNHRHGASNPAVPASEPVTAQAVLDSAVVVWPLTDLMVAPSGAGAAAVVLVGDRTRRRLDVRPARVRASVLRGSNGANGGHDIDAGAASLAYHLAGLGPDELDCAEVHDDTAAAELAAYETLQMVPAGQGPELIDTGFTALGGVLPVNSSGGMLSLGELHGASAIAQICELVTQLRGAGGKRQAADVRTALAMSRGPAQEHGEAVVGVTVLTSA